MKIGDGTGIEDDSYGLWWKPPKGKQYVQAPGMVTVAGDLVWLTCRPNDYPNTPEKKIYLRPELLHRRDKRNLQTSQDLSTDLP
jgi:hypothetical protein